MTWRPSRRLIGVTTLVGDFTRAAFRMYDDEGAPSCRGRTFDRHGLEGTEELVSAQLAEFGLPKTSCTRTAWNDRDDSEIY